MNKLITIIASCLFLLTFMSSCNRTDEERCHILKVYNWADYIDEDVLAEFPAWYKEQTGEDIRIIYQVSISMRSCLPKSNAGMKIST